MKTSVVIAFAALAFACSSSSAPVDRPKPKPDNEPAKPAKPVSDEELVSAKVAEVAVRGLVHIGESRARLAIALRRGDSFNRTAIRESLRGLMTIHGIADARAVAFRTDAGGIGVAFIITETPRITSLEVRGNKAVPTNELLKLAGLAVGQPFVPAAAQKAALAMKDRYTFTGHHAAQIDWNSGPTGVVIFQVREGVKASISKISITGAKAITSARLNNILLKAHPENTVGGVYLKAGFEAGVQKIAAAYYDVGHVNVQVGPHAYKSPTPATIEVTVPIKEGPQFRVGKLEVGGKISGPARAYVRQLKSRRGQIFSRTAIQADIERLTKFHRTKAKVENPVVTPLTNVDLEKKRIDIKFDIDQ